MFRLFFALSFVFILGSYAASQKKSTKSASLICMCCVTLPSVRFSCANIEMVDFQDAHVIFFSGFFKWHTEKPMWKVFFKGILLLYMSRR